MRSRLHHHVMADDRRGMYVHIVPNDDAAHTGHMCINTVPVTDVGIMSYDRVRRNHIVVTYNSIVPNDRVSPNEVALAQFRPLVDTCRLGESAP